MKSYFRLLFSVYPGEGRSISIRPHMLASDWQLLTTEPESKSACVMQPGFITCSCAMDEDRQGLCGIQWRHVMFANVHRDDSKALVDLEKKTYCCWPKREMTATIKSLTLSPIAFANRTLPRTEQV